MRVPLNTFLQREKVVGNEHLFQKAWNEFKMLDGMKVSEMNDRQKALVLIFTKRVIGKDGGVKRSVHQIAVHTLACLEITQSTSTSSSEYKIHIDEDIECQLEATVHHTTSEAPFISSILKLEEGFLPVEHHIGKTQYRIFYNKEYMVTVREAYEDKPAAFESVPYPAKDYAEVYREILRKAPRLPTRTSDKASNAVWSAIYAWADREGDFIVNKPECGVDFQIRIDSGLPVHKPVSVDKPLRGSIGFYVEVETDDIAEAIYQWAKRIYKGEPTRKDLYAQSVQCPKFKETCKKLFLDIPKIETMECVNSGSFPTHSLSIIMDQYFKA